MNIFQLAGKLITFCLDRKYRRKILSFQRISRTPRFTPVRVGIFDHPFEIADSASFLHQYQEIFLRKIYRFNSETRSPYIIDGGANIGLATIFWKQQYPAASIIAFEPDKEIFKTLEFNIHSLMLSNIQLIRKGLWNAPGILAFTPEGADAGRIDIIPGENSLSIDVTDLNPYLNKKTDLLKLDIEGAETEVLVACEEKLFQVDRIFIEYHSFADKPQTLDKILSILSANNFRYIIQHTGEFSNNPFLKICSYKNMDLQLNIFAYKPEIVVEMQRHENR